MMDQVDATGPDFNLVLDIYMYELNHYRPLGMCLIFSFVLDFRPV